MVLGIFKTILMDFNEKNALFGGHFGGHLGFKVFK